MLVDSGASAFLGSDSVRFHNIGDENFPITNVTGTCSVQKNVYGFFQEVIANHDYQIPSLYIASAVRYATIDMPLFLISNSGYIPVTKKVDLNLMQGFFYLIKFGFSNNCLDFFHN